MEATVRVMRSYDYCNFEVSLTEEAADIDGVNELRKQAAVLVDEAVRQYKIAKGRERLRETSDIRKADVISRIHRLECKPECDRTPEEAAFLRSTADKEFWSQFEQDDFTYSESAEREHHFSMLRKFKGTRVSAA